MRGRVVGRPEYDPDLFASNFQVKCLPMPPLLAVYHEHCESIGQESFLRIPSGRSWRRLTMSPIVFAVSVLLLASCASNRGTQKHSSDTPFLDAPDDDSIHL